MLAAWADEVGRQLQGQTVLAEPVHGLHRLAWIWMGDPALVKVADISVFSHLIDETRRHVKGHSTVNCRYRPKAV